MWWAGDVGVVLVDGALYINKEAALFGEQSGDNLADASSCDGSVMDETMSDG
jgi:hypothetical protein